MFGYIKDALRQWNDRRYYARIRKAATEREARRVAERTPIDRLDPLLRELVEIGYTTDYRESERVREIGEVLHSRGGLQNMQRAYYELLNWHNVNARGLSQAWDRIGDWQA